MKAIVWSGPLSVRARRDMENEGFRFGYYKGIPIFTSDNLTVEEEGVVESPGWRVIDDDEGEETALAVRE